MVFNHSRIEHISKYYGVAMVLRIYAFFFLLHGYSNTLCHFDGFIELGVPHLRLFLILSKISLKRCVATEIDLTALFKNEAMDNILMSIVAGPLHFVA